MSKRLTREELIDLVNKIIECEGSEEEIDEMIEVVKRNVPYPDISDLIYWSEDELTQKK